MFARAPLRISYGGGGTDLDPYRSEHGGVCLGVAIQKYAVSSKGGCNSSSLISAILKRMNSKDGIELDVGAPPFSGLGASGSIAVSAIGLLANGTMDKSSIAQLAFDIERNDLTVTGGFQDQIISAFGGMIYIEFGSERFNVIQMDRNSFIDELEYRTILVYTGKREVSGSEVQDDVLNRQVVSPNLEALDRIKEIANEQRRLVRAGDIHGFCELLHYSWEEKKKLSPNVTNSNIDTMYEMAHGLGASGKICGAGNGGYFLLVCPDSVSSVFHHLFEMGFAPERVKFDWEGLVVRK